MKSNPFPSVLIVMMIVLLIPASAFALSPFKVALNFMCACGTCDETLSECECPQSDGYRADLKNMINKGMSEDQIINEFVGRYGSSVLVANAGALPPARSAGGGLSRQTVGVVLVVLGLSLVMMMMFRYMKPAPQPSGRRRSSGKKRSTGTQQRNKTSGPGKKGKKESGFRDGVDDDLLDDYIDD